MAGSSSVNNSLTVGPVLCCLGEEWKTTEYIGNIRHIDSGITVGIPQLHIKMF